MFNFYRTYWLPFGQLLSDMEIAGIGVDAQRLQEFEAQATAERRRLSAAVRKWVTVSSRRLFGDEVATANLDALNLSSDSQIRQVLFGGAWNRNRKLGRLPPVADFPGVAQSEETPQLAENHSARIKKVTIRGLALGLKPTAWTEKGWPSVSCDALRQLVAHQPDALGADGVEAVKTLVKIAEVEGAVDGFLRPLQTHVRDGRVFSSFNLNTVTGRLSSRSPNLQNQPVGGPFPVREAFVAAPGRTLVVADYQQLELRIMAHLAGCRPMIDQLSSGGDLHSCTAARMFPHVASAVQRKEVTVNNFGQEVPSVKSLFPTERRLAKILNFGMLYGKSAKAVARDWNVSTEEAQKLIEDWFKLYPGIRPFKETVERSAIEHCVVRTLLGRTRRVQNVQSMNESLAAAVLRSATHTPIQGTAADIVTVAMLKLCKSSVLREMGYCLILQVHDEVILEGPQENAHAAKQEVKYIMEKPLASHLKVPLPVSVGSGRTWQDAQS